MTKYYVFGLVLLISVFANDAVSPVYHEYCVVGAGPAGVQTGYFLHQDKRDYIVFERSHAAGAFFRKYPRHRQLISINKRNTGTENEEFNMRHDWNSLLTNPRVHEKQLKFTSYSNKMFPNASLLAQYIDDFVQLYEINVKTNTSIENINCVDSTHSDCESEDEATKKSFYFEKYNRNQKYCSRYEMNDQNGNKYVCKVLIISSGMWKPNVPENLKMVEGYEDASIDPNDYEGKSVLILGRGNSAFELAQSIYGSTNFVHMVSRSHLRNAYQTHYVGDVRGVNNDIFDTYQLKSLDGFLDIDLKMARLEHFEGKYYLMPSEEYFKEMNIPLTNFSQYQPFPSQFMRIGYDKVIRCLGFKFDFSLFNSSMKFSTAKGRISKYPVINYDYESRDYSNLYFAGTVTHSLDFRKSSGGFVHGFRYTIRALHRLMEYRYHGVKWPSIELPITSLLNYALVRINEAAGPYQMFDQLVDVISFKDDNETFEYFEEIPLGLVDEFSKITGKTMSKFVIINFEYGPDFSGPDKDVFRLDRVTGDVKNADKSNFLHPVLYYFEKMPKLAEKKTNEDILKLADAVHHMIEEFTTFWTTLKEHRLHLRRFFEFILDTDLRDFKLETCTSLLLTHGTYPISCRRYFNENFS